eukprot:GEMP01051736.1.p1 GENE.GEMP01051736.1~~GEMP01051736.1.p1  ORF type:complete len:239 (+),score=79.09 GEMP01051736.1:161-877(+)
MVKTKAQKKHGRGERRVAGFDEVAARNDNAVDRRAPPPIKEESENESEGEGKEKEPSSVKHVRMDLENTDIITVNGYEEQESGVRAGLSRKQREELDKAEAKKRYEKLHKEGKTDEAKSDLARLAEVKARREKQRLEREAAEKAAEEAKPQRGDRNEELLEALGGDAARMRGARSKENKKKKELDKAEGGAAPAKRNPAEDAVYAGYLSLGMDAVKKDLSNAEPGTIDACRAAEDDFM